MSSLSGESNKDVHSDNGVMKISTSGDADQFITIGKNTYYKHELMQAFGGSLNPGYAPFPTRDFGNPSPLGLCGFALTTFVLSMFNAQAMGIKVPNVVIGLACFYGGFAQFCAGIWEGFIGNTFAMCALTSYGGFWLSFAAIHIEAFGIAKAYKGHDGQLANAVGFFLTGWAIFTFMLTMCTIKSTVAFCSLFVFLTITFILLAAGEFSGVVGVSRAGGVTGIITAFIAFYNAFAGTATRKNSYITANPIRLPWAR
ncbi:hypothetical protein JCM33374_g2151 [Metschnikowia sp. JCM 33374]|nr:hypothetical protein JCM33374_g2151 [Metschnikowia sp. JCM 33374]